MTGDKRLFHSTVHVHLTMSKSVIFLRSLFPFSLWWNNSWPTTISLTSRTISTRSLAIAEPGIAESGWTNGERECARHAFAPWCQNTSAPKPRFNITTQIISCPETRGRANVCSPSAEKKKRLLICTIRSQSFEENKIQSYDSFFWWAQLFAWIFLLKLASAKSTSFLLPLLFFFNKLAGINPLDIYQNFWLCIISIHLG